MTTKVTYWNRYADASGYTEYHTYKFKHMWPWVFLKLCHIRIFYDEMEMEEE